MPNKNIAEPLILNDRILQSDYYIGRLLLEAYKLKVSQTHFINGNLSNFNSS